MLHFITSITDRLIEYIKDDPVRPEIPKESRVEKNRFIAALTDDSNISSMVCISLHDFVPTSISELLHSVSSDSNNTAVFYTIWSYKAGSGAALIRQAVTKIQENHPNITTFVTLSPKTEMARRFHLKNGAIILRENEDSVNYKYQI